MNTQHKKLELHALEGIPLIKKGDDIAALSVEAAAKTEVGINNRDILVIAQKIVSKAEGSVRDLKTITPSTEANELARKTGRDARLCQVYLDESQKVIRIKGRHVITIHRLGFEGTGAGVDRSNIATHEESIVTLLPKDPDLSARIIRARIKTLTGNTVAVIINDSFGRSDREGSVGTAIGLAGIVHLEERQQTDIYHNPSRSSIALVDELAAAASILMGQADEKIPVVLIHGADFTVDENATIQKLLFQKGY